MLRVPSVDLNVKLDGLTNTGFYAMPDMSVQATSAPMSRRSSSMAADVERFEPKGAVALVYDTPCSSPTTSLRSIKVRKVGQHQGRKRPFTLHIDSINITMPMVSPQPAAPVLKSKMRSIAVQAGEPQVPYTRVGPWGQRWLKVCRLCRPLKKVAAFVSKTALLIIGRVGIGVNLTPLFTAQVR